MKRMQSGLLLAVAAFGCLAMGGCVIAPPRARVVAVAPVQVWVPGCWYGGVWVRGHWRYR
ncbi:MAG: hypothetical protein EPN36_09405 [Rhodanobacteraceae bacterium]|nr:MAG: hypothetical protein EPN36_09405 [Rhodanobacteraceae bacterium]